MIVSEVKERMYFTILADEANDIGNKKQMSLVLRYRNKNGEIFESFVSFLQRKYIGGSIGKAYCRCRLRFSMKLSLKPIECRKEIALLSKFNLINLSHD